MIHGTSYSARTAVGCRRPACDCATRSWHRVRGPESPLGLLIWCQRQWLINLEQATNKISMPRAALPMSTAATRSFSGMQRITTHCRSMLMPPTSRPYSAEYKFGQQQLAVPRVLHESR